MAMLYDFYTSYAWDERWICLLATWWYAGCGLWNCLCGQLYPWGAHWFLTVRWICCCLCVASINSKSAWILWKRCSYAHFARNDEDGRYGTRCWRYRPHSNSRPRWWRVHYYAIGSKLGAGKKGVTLKQACVTNSSTVYVSSTAASH